MIITSGRGNGGQTGINEDQGSLGGMKERDRE